MYPESLLLPMDHFSCVLTVLCYSNIFFSPVVYFTLIYGIYDTVFFAVSLILQKQIFGNI